MSDGARDRARDAAGSAGLGEIFDAAFIGHRPRTRRRFRDKERDVRPFRETHPVVPDFSPHIPEVGTRITVEIVDEHHAVRNTHPQEDGGKGDAPNHKSVSEPAVTKGYLAELQAHAIVSDFCGHHAGQRLERHLRRSHAVFERESRDATGPVSAHFPFAAVRIEKAHAEMSARRRFHDKDAVGAHGCLPLTRLNRELGKILRRHRFVRIADHDKVIPVSMHLRKRDHRNPPLIMRSPPLPAQVT